jgi:energy-coupling factor transporter ATP-binding protein EcfA2
LKAVEFRNVSYTYPNCKDQIIQNLNLEINPGEFVGLVGLTGTGKTTLFRLINGLIPHYFGGKLEGEVFVDDMNTADRSIGELSSSVGSVFQEADSQLFFPTVEDDLAFGPENLCVPRDEIVCRVEEVLTKSGLGDLRHKAPGNLSEGQKQLVALSAVLAMKPKVLLLDEPTANLDSENSWRILDFVMGLNREGMTVILATHEIDVLAECASRIVLMDDGQVRATGSPDEVFAKLELLEKVGLAAPQVTQLAQKLRGEGIDLGKLPVRVCEAFDLLVRRLNA